MADVSFPSRFGLDSGDNQALFLKVFANEVLVAFEDFNIMKGLTRRRTITSGKSAQFPIVGTADAVYHTVGEDLLRETVGTVTVPKYLSRPGTGEKVISIDNMLTSSTLVSKIDELMAHWDVRGPYAQAMGRALAEKYDLSLMQVCFNGSEQSGALSGEGSWDAGGVQLTDTDFLTDTDSIKTTIEDAAQSFDERDIPKNDRHFVLRPEQYRMLLSHVPNITAAGATVQIGSTLTPGVGADVGKGTVNMYHGFHLWASNRIDDLINLGNITAAETGQRGTDYTGDFTNAAAVFFQREGLGTVELLSLQTETEYVIEFQADVLLAKMAVGHGVLHEAACGSVITG